MKKLIGILLGILFMTGCACNMNVTKDTPTKKVEEFFSNYQKMDDDVNVQLENVVNNQTDFTEEQKKEYKEIMKKHYQNLKYDIKEEEIDGDNATVTVEIEVTDYSKIMADADTYLSEHQDEFNDEEGVYDVTLFNKYRLEQLKKATDTVKYTLDLSLTKVDEKWVLDPISDTDESKIQGTYVY